MATVKTLETEVELLKKEVADMGRIHIRLDTAIEKIAEVSSSLHTIMAVHEEKITRQEETLDEQEENCKTILWSCTLVLRLTQRKHTRQWVTWKDALSNK